MKKILLTALSLIAVISATEAQNAAARPATGLQINRNGLRPRAMPSGKTSSGAVTPSSGKTPTGSVGTSTTTSSGKPDMGGSSSGSTTTPSGKPNMGGTSGSSTTTPSSGSVSTSDAATAVKQLLTAGVTAAVSKVSVTDGYFGNPEIKIPLPTELQGVGSLLTTYGAGALVDKLTLQLNRSAEQSATLATPVFINSLSQITPTDAVNIITGAQPDAATQFLKRTTTEQLVVAFKPKVKTVLDATKTSAAYSEVMNLYNKIPFVSKVSADLPDYVTRKALDGLFVMVSKEEARIRQNPAAAGSSILSKVLGAVLGQSSLKANQGISSRR